MLLSNHDIREIIKKQTDKKWTRNKAKFLGGADRSYFLPKFSDINDILLGCSIGHRYKDEIFDCDDFALTFKSKLAYFAVRRKSHFNNHPIAGGVFWGRTTWESDNAHAANFIVCQDRKIYWIEPQYNNKSSKKKALRLRGDVSHLKLMIF